MRLLINKSSLLSTPQPMTSTQTQDAPTTSTAPAQNLSSLQARLHPAKSNMYWDNACSYHVTNDSSLLRQMRPIHSATFSGVGGPGKATHVGYLPFLPSINFLNVAYYAPDFPQTLLSLGQIQACGGAYGTMGTNHLRVLAIATNPNSV